MNKLTKAFFVEPGETLTRMVEEYVRERSVQYSPPIADTLVRALREELARGISLGERISDLTRRVDRVLVDQGPMRAERIVRTEVLGGFNRGSFDSYKSSGLVEQKEWVTARDPRVRGTDPRDEFNHVNADGQVVGVDQPFTVGDEQLMYPGDPVGSPGNIINCRCAMLPVLGPEPIAEEPPVAEAEAEIDVTGIPIRATDTEVEAFLSRRSKISQGEVRSAVRRDRKEEPFNQEAFDRAVKEKTANWKKRQKDYLDRAMNVKWFRDKAMIPDMMDNVSQITASDMGDKDSYADFNPTSRLIRMNYDVMAKNRDSDRQIARHHAHELFHNLSSNRKWQYTEFGGLIWDKEHPEAAKIYGFWRDAVDKTISVMREKDTSKGKQIADKLEQIKRSHGARFGRSYEEGIGKYYKDISWYIPNKKIGIDRSYSLHSPHEFATTMYELYVDNPDMLKKINEPVFNFYDSYYKTGVFKRIIEILRRAVWQSKGSLLMREARRLAATEPTRTP